MFFIIKNNHNNCVVFQYLLPFVRSSIHFFQWLWLLDRENECHLACKNVLWLSAEVCVGWWHWLSESVMYTTAVITITSVLDCIAVGPKFTQLACHMQPTMRIARRYTALLLPLAAPGTDRRTLHRFIYTYHNMVCIRSLCWASYLGSQHDAARIHS